MSRPLASAIIIQDSLDHYSLRLYNMITLSIV